MVRTFNIDNLKANHISHPLGLEESPDLSWQIKGGVGIIQKSYRILVASSEEKLRKGSADLWDSGIIPSSQSVHLPYQGKSLGSGQRAYWKVRVWDQKGRASDFSNTAWWEMGLLETEDWQAQWISPIPPSEKVPPVLPSPYFRKEFQVENPIKSARLYVSGLGYFEAFINGKKVGNHVLDPMITRYDKRVKYLVFDVKKHIQSSNNAIGVVLGNGWYNQHTRTAWDFDQAPWRESPSLRCQLVLEDESGKVQVIPTDETWKYSYGPIVLNGIHNGETYDVRLELGSWSEPQHENPNWKSAIEVPGPEGKMSSQLMPPIRVIDRLHPVITWQVNDSVMMVDLGQNLTGWANIKVKGPKGSPVKLKYGERIYEDSTLDIQELSRFIWTGDTQTDRYILKGEGEENWHPLFTYHGFQYIEVTLGDPAIELTDIVAEVVHSDLSTKGYFNWWRLVTSHHTGRLFPTGKKKGIK